MRVTVALLALALLGLTPGCASEPTLDRAPRPSPTGGAARARPVVALLTDFGTRDDAVGLLRGVVLSIARDAAVVDVTHEVPPFDVSEGARLLEDAPGIYPEGAVIVVVVDPGVGTARRPLAVRLRNGRFLVGPDNGVLSPAMERYGVAAARVIEDPRFLREASPGATGPGGVGSTTFHGRDVFSSAGAHLALGDPPFEGIGPLVLDWVKLPAARPTISASSVTGSVVAIDEPFGNLWTNVTPEDLAKVGVGASPSAPASPPAADYGRKLRCTFELPAGPRTVELTIVKTFGDVPLGKPLAYWSSRGKLAIALNQGDAARTLGVARGTRVSVEKP